MNKPAFNKQMEFRKSGRYWLNALEKMPYKSTEIEPVRFERSIERDFVILLINSSLFYLYWSTYGDSRHFPLSLLEKFPFPGSRELEKNEQKMERLKTKYSTCLISSFTPIRGTRGEFKTGLCKDIIDEIDEFLGQIYGLGADEVVYIKNFDASLLRVYDSSESAGQEDDD